MPASLVPCLVLLLAAAPPAGATGDDVASLVEAERAFARTSVEKGTREAFLAFLAEDSVLFRPGPVPGRPWIEERPAAPGVLAWEPVAAEVSASGDFGYTTGPWTFRSEDGTNTAHGHYFSVWKRQADGAWKVLVDVGVFTPPPASPAVPWQGGENPARWVRAEGAAADPAGEEEALLAQERELSRAIGEGQVAAYVAHLTADARLLRSDRPPALGREAAGEAVGGMGRISESPAAAGVAAAGDLGYTYGAYEEQPAGAEDTGEKGHYVRVWRREPDGVWRLAVDLMVHQPPPPPPEPEG